MVRAAVWRLSAAHRTGVASGAVPVFPRRAWFWARGFGRCGASWLRPAVGHRGKSTKAALPTQQFGGATAAGVAVAAVLLRRTWARTAGRRWHVALSGRSARCSRVARAADEGGAAPAATDVAEVAGLGDDLEADEQKDGGVEAAEDSQSRVAESMELLSHFSEEAHPGHQPGRFAGPGREYDGMEFDGLRWHVKPTQDAGDASNSTALATLSPEDQYLVTKFESEGGLALCLSNAFTLPDKMRAKARHIIKAVEGGASPSEALASVPPDEEVDDSLVLKELEAVGLREAVEGAFVGSAMDKAVILFQAADLIEERESVMRNVWSDVEFHGGEESNAELVTKLEQQFAQQLLRTTENRFKAEDEAAKAQERNGATATSQQPSQEETAGGPSAAAPMTPSEQDLQDAAAAIAAAAAAGAPLPPEAVAGSAAPKASASTGRLPSAAAAEDEEGAAAAAELAAAAAESEREEDGIFEIALRDCSGMADLAQRLPPKELSKTLLEPRNLGVALDLVGVYLKNYEIDKADLVISRVVPLCRKRGGTWLVKGLDKLSAVRMKQFRAYDALEALREIEEVVPFAPEEGWEFHDILYRNLAWCYSALDEAERCLLYTRKSVEVKRACGIPASWFDIWDLGKGHARIGQKTNQRSEMQVAYDLCVKAGQIHRKAEASDRIMLAKILSNVGEVAMGLGDSFKLDGDAASAHEWYVKAEPSLRESYELHVGALGPMKPLAGWAAGTCAHCMVRLERWEDAREYLAMAMKVECSKDSTTPGSVIELLDRVLGVQQELKQPRGMAAFVNDLELVLTNLRDRGWERRERDIFALLLQRVATAFLLADDGTGSMVVRALDKLREAENDLNIYLGTNKYRCGDCGKMYADLDELEAHRQRRHAPANAEGGGDRLDVAPKRFGPQADPQELLHQVQSSISILEMGAESLAGTAGEPTKTDASSRFEEVVPPPGRTAVGFGAGTSTPAVEAMPFSPSSSSSSFAAAPAAPAATGLASDGLAALGGLSEPEDVALSRNYALVGSWSNWASFDDLSREADGFTFAAEIDVPAGKDIQFQVVCDRSWKRRLFPAADGAAILGPSSGGHGNNWSLRAPDGPAMLRVRFDPRGRRRLDYSVVRHAT